MFEVFKYRINYDRYWNRAKLYKQIVNKTLSITKAFYLGYLLLYLFNNVRNQFIYAKNTLQVKDINKK